MGIRGKRRMDSFSIQLPPDVVDKLEELCLRQRTSRAALIRQAVDLLLERQERLDKMQEAVA